MFCGVLRMCNLFPHAIRNMSDFFPARKLVVCIYFSVLLLLPCVIYPQSPDALLLARCFWILYIPASASLAFRLFFQPGRSIGRVEYLCVGGVPLAVMLVMSAVSLLGGTHYVAMRILLQALLISCSSFLPFISFASPGGYGRCFIVRQMYPLYLLRDVSHLVFSGFRLSLFLLHKLFIK